MVVLHSQEEGLWLVFVVNAGGGSFRRGVLRPVAGSDVIRACGVIVTQEKPGEAASATGGHEARQFVPAVVEVYAGQRLVPDACIAGDVTAVRLLKEYPASPEAKEVQSTAVAKS